MGADKSNLHQTVESSVTPAEKQLRHLRVHTHELPGKDALRLWQEEYVPYWEIRPVGSPEDKFESSAEIHQLGDMALGSVRTPAQWIDRSRYRIAQDGFTQFGVQVVMEGHIGKRDAGPEALASEPGDLLISDLAQCSTLETSNLSALFFSVPRDALAPLLDAPDHHNQRVISGADPVAALLRSHLMALHENAARMDAATLQSVLAPTLQLTAAVLNAQITEAEADAVTLARTMEIRRYVDEWITDPHLTPEAVAGRFGMSVRKLYYLFEPFGGFAAYVRERRLHHVREALENPRNRSRSIADLASEVGFGNYAAFVRAFRRTFEMSPRELRALAQRRPWTRVTPRSNAWHHWLLQTR